MFSAKSKLFLSVEFQSNSEAPFMSSFVSFHLQVAPLTLFIDENFLSDFLTFFTTLSAPAGSPEPAVKPSQLVTFETLKLGTFLLSVTVRWKTGRRLSHRFSPFIPWFILPTTNGRIHLESRTFQNVCSPLNSLSTILSDAYSWADLLGFAEIVPRSLHDLATGVASLSTGEVPTDEPFLLSSIEGALRTVADFVWPADEKHTRAAGVNQSARQTLGEGIDSLGSGIMSGLTGVVLEPVAGARREGGLGVIKGIGKGILGLVRRPLGGVLDAAVGVVSSAQKVIAKGEVIARMRNPRVLVLAQVAPFDPEMANAQATFHRSVPDSSADMFVFCLRVDTGGALAVTTEYLIVFVDCQTIRDLHQLSRIKQATTHGAKLLIDLPHVKQKLAVVCASADEAKTAERVLTRAIISKSHTDS
jgi:hypothetical protein